MSVADKITRLTTARNNIRTALANKGVSASSHGFEDFAGDIGSIQMPNAVVARATISSRVFGNTVTLITADAKIAAHYADADATAILVALQTPITEHDVPFIINTNHNNSKYGGNAYGVYLYNSASADNATAITKALSAASGSSAAYLTATSAGNLIAYVNTARYLDAGDYLVAFVW